MQVLGDDASFRCNNKFSAELLPRLIKKLNLILQLSCEKMYFKLWAVTCYTVEQAVLGFSRGGGGFSKKNQLNWPKFFLINRAVFELFHCTKNLFFWLNYWRHRQFFEHGVFMRFLQNFEKIEFFLARTPPSKKN